MEFVKMYFVVIFTLLTWAVMSSESIDSLTFEGTEPVPVLVGSNVTLKWTYSGQEDQIRIISFNFLDEGNDLEKIARYKFAKKTTETVDLHGYCGSVVWVGNTTGGIAAFRMNNISMLAHGITFAVDIYSGSNITEVNDPQKIFISVPPKVQLKISNTNVASGDDVTIECEVIQGRPSPTILWYHNGTILTGKTGKYLLNSENVRQENAGTYQCLATNNAGISSSMVVNVTVYKKPTAAPNISIRFEGTKPKTASVSSNIILNWTYSETVDKVMIINFGIWDSGFASLNNMARFLVDKNKLEILNIGKYCDSIEWLGETTKNVAAFKMNNISELAHGKTFAVEFYFGPEYTSQKDLHKIFLSGEGNIGKRSTDVNTYAVLGIMVGFWSMFVSWLHVDLL